ncbi:hypothetical protein XAV_05805 [Xanthomonas axonopodis pv. vasculorum]|nr:hypothetical protein XAV_05805 [Xanthomonas axonopodis pv. vasculorum]
MPRRRIGSHGARGCATSAAGTSSPLVSIDARGAGQRGGNARHRALRRLRQFRIGLARYLGNL